jgi:hypothetical protein
MALVKKYLTDSQGRFIYIMKAKGALPTEVGEEYGGGIVAYLGSEGDFENGMISAAEDTSTGYQWGCQGNHNWG